MLIGAKSCRNCKHRLKMNDIVLCTAHPPQIVAVPVPNPKAPGGMMWQTQSSYPAVAPDFPCGEHERSETFAMEELSNAGEGVEGRA